MVDGFGVAVRCPLVPEESSFEIQSWAPGASRVVPASSRCCCSPVNCIRSSRDTASATSAWYRRELGHRTAECVAPQPRSRLDVDQLDTNDNSLIVVELTSPVTTAATPSSCPMVRGSPRRSLYRKRVLRAITRVAGSSDKRSMSRSAMPSLRYRGRRHLSGGRRATRQSRRSATPLPTTRYMPAIADTRHQDERSREGDDVPPGQPRRACGQA